MIMLFCKKKKTYNLQLNITVLEQLIPIIPAPITRGHAGTIRNLVQHGIWVGSF